MQGQSEAGIAQLREGLAVYRATGTENRRPEYLAMLVEILKNSGQVTEGLRLLHEALTQVERTGERYWEAELYRLRAELLLAQSVDNHTEAEPSLHKALAIAGSQSAKSLELRAATSLAKLWQQQVAALSSRF